MKKLGIFERIIFWANAIVAFLLIISFVLPYIPPKNFPTLSILSLGVSPLILVNILFVFYWLIRLKKKIFLSLIVLIIAYLHFSSFFEFSSEGDTSEYRNSISVLSYNVRLFNAYEEKPSADIPIVVNKMLESQQPDVFFVQEYYRESKLTFPEYPYKFIHFKNDDAKLGHAIFSKYPLINKGAFDFKKTYNNTLYADVVKGGDTVRIYNLHLKSLGIKPSVTSLQEGDTEKLMKRISNAFVAQEEQVKAIIDHKKLSPYPVLLCGDFNNTPFSFVYRKLNNNMKDAFLERGNGLGTTYLFDSYPMRIDYILTSESFDIIKFETINESFSDHYPISATVGWN